MVYKEQVSRENLVVDSAATTTRTVALTGSGFPDATNTLVALVNISTSTAIATPAGWTASGVGGANGNNQMRMFLKQGDGATNSITIESVSAIATVGIFVAAGYAGLTPIISGGANGGTGTQFPFSGISGQPGNGLTILGIGLATAPSSWSSWSASNPILASQPSTARGWWGVSDYIDGQGSPNSTVTWLGSRSQRYIAVVLPLQVAATNPTAGADLSGSGALAAAAQPSNAGMATMGGSGALAASGVGQGAVTAGLGGSGALTASGTPSVTQPGALTGSGDLTTIAPPASGSTVPTQAEMPAAPFDLYPAPTYSWGAGSAPSGSGYVSLAPNDARIRLVGPAGKGTQAGTVAGFVNPAPLQDIAGAGTGTNPLVFPPYGIRARNDATEVWFRVAQRSYSGFSNVSARAASRLKVNGKMTSLTPVYLGANLGMPANPDNLAAGEYWLKATFSTTEMRDLEFTTHLEFGGIVVPTGTTIGTPPAPAHRIVVFDGSLPGAEKHQTGNFALTGGSAGTYTAVSSYIWYAAQIMAYDDVINSATGSSGYAISGDTVSIKSTNKIPRDGADHNPATVIIGGPNNDLSAGRTVAQIEADLDIILPSVNSLMPNALRFIEGAFTAPAMGSQASAEASVAPVNAAIKAKAQQYGFWLINPTTGETYDPQGVLRKKTSNWVYQDTSSISSDGVHPTQDGSRKLGIMLADAMMPAHASGAVEASAALTGAGALAVAGAPSQAATSAFTGSGALAASGVASVARAAGLTGSGSLVASGSAAVARGAAFGGSGSLTAAGAPSIARGAALTGEGVLASAVPPTETPLWTVGFEDGNPFTGGPTTLDSITTAVAHSGASSLYSNGNSNLAHRVRYASQAFAMGTILRGWVRVSTGSPRLAGISFTFPDTTDNFAALIDTRNLTGSSAGFQISENRQLGGDHAARTTGAAPSEAIQAERWYLIEALYDATTVTARLYRDDGVQIATLSRTLNTLTPPTTYRPALYSYGDTWHDDVSVAAVGSVPGATFGGSGSLVAGASVAVSTAPTLSGSGALTAPARPALAVPGGFTGSGALASVTRPSAAVTVPLAGAGTLGAATESAGAASPALGGSGQLAAAARASVVAAAVFAGAGSLTAAGVAGNAAAASLAGAGQLAAAAAFRVIADTLLSGSGSLGATPRFALAVRVDLDGSGSLSVAVGGAAVILGSHTFVISPWADGAGHDVELHKRRAYAEITGRPLSRGRVAGMTGPTVTVADNIARVTYTLIG